MELIRPHLCNSSFLFFMALLITLTKSELLSTDPSYYYNRCAPSTCGTMSLQFPFSLSRECGHLNQVTTCPDNRTVVLTTPTSTDSYRLLSVNYTDPASITVFVASESLCTCGAQFTKPTYKVDGVWFTLPLNYSIGSYLNCTAPIPLYSIPGLENASCLACSDRDPSNNYHCYYARGVVTTPGCQPQRVFSYGPSFNATRIGNGLRAFLQQGFELKYVMPTECLKCKASGGRCGNNPLSGSFVCYCSSSVHRVRCSDDMIEDLSKWVNVTQRKGSKLSLAVSAAIFVPASALVVGIVIALVAVFLCKRKNKFSSTEEAISRVSLAPYSYSQLKKFSNNFSTKIGEGGFGSVYDGTIPQRGNEIRVAIKIMKKSRQTKKQFMNEVATVGSIHHHNLVSLLGYCVEGETHALIYEFMENGSLDAYIFKSKKANPVKDESITEHKWLTSKQVYNIALETARGILYLHNGCNKKILHCDIKPLNILLDSNFSAKVADFGLAKLINKGHSHVSLTMAQGTPGYAAPEIWLKNLGPVTEKSDVYSYGMLLLEMVGRRRSYDPEAPVTSQVYFPEWLYNNIARIEAPLPLRNWDHKDSLEIDLDEEPRNEEDEVLERMCMVALWCIQYIPSIRPSMTKVVQMLEGHVEIEMPPHPFPQNPINGEGVTD